MAAFTEEEVQAFIAEAEDLLDGAEKSLLQLDKGEPLKPHYDSIFRAFHSIKGAAGMMDMFELQSHMHQLETIFVEQKTLSHLSKPHIDLFLRGLDGTRTILGGGKIQFSYATTAPATAETLSTAVTPTAQPAAQVAVQVAVQAEAFSPPVSMSSLGRILVVDDEPELVDNLCESLNLENIETRGLTSPMDVLANIASFQPNCVFLDISMPGKSGIQVLAEISKVYPDLPVIFLSGNVDKQALMDGLRLGVFGVLEKPCDPKTIMTYAINAIEKHKMAKILSRSINLLMFQFSDLSEFLQTQGRADVQLKISNEITALLHSRKTLRSRKASSAA